MFPIRLSNPIVMAIMAFTFVCGICLTESQARNGRGFLGIAGRRADRAGCSSSYGCQSVSYCQSAPACSVSCSPQKNSEPAPVDTNPTSLPATPDRYTIEIPAILSDQELLNEIEGLRKKVRDLSGNLTESQKQRLLSHLQNIDDEVNIVRTANLNR